MKTWIAFLRGINVGGKHIVPMKELTKLMEANGFTNVRTYIQSGNVVFESPFRPKQEIGDLIQQRFGFTPSIFTMNVKELRIAATHCPFPSDLGKAVHFFFFQDEPKQVDYGLIDSLKAATEEYALVKNVFYLHAPEGIGRSKLAEKLDKVFFKTDMTARNLNTINKLLEMVG